jgi:hypothetical protein
MLHLDEIVSVYLTKEGMEYLRRMTQEHPEKLLLLAGRSGKTHGQRLRLTLREIMGLFGEAVAQTPFGAQTYFEGNYIEVYPNQHP